MSTAVRSRVFKISAAAVTAAIAIGLCLFSQDDVSASIKERRVERLNAQIENVYTDEYQQMMDTEIADERDAKERTVDSIYTVRHQHHVHVRVLHHRSGLHRQLHRFR